MRFSASISVRRFLVTLLLFPNGSLNITRTPRDKASSSAVHVRVNQGERTRARHGVPFSAEGKAARY